MSPYGLTPEEEQRIAAETIRSGQVLGAAAQRGSRFDNMAAISLLANNKAAAAAAGSAQTRALAGSKPTALGGRGFMVDGQFITDPGYVQEKLEGRAQQRGLAFDKATAAAQQAEMNRELRRDLASQAGALRMAIAASKAGGGEKPGKTLPFGAIDKLSKKEGVRDAYIDLADSFKDEFSGNPAIAGLENLGGRFLPGVTGKGDQANWWQNYQEQTNLVRNQLFGSALTATEKASFDAQNIVPGMDAGEIKRRLAQQTAIADKAYSKLVKATKDSGYDTSGFTTDRLAAPATKPGAQPAKAGGAPAGVDPADWAVMTPQERALWQ